MESAGPLVVRFSDSLALPRASGLGNLTNTVRAASLLKTKQGSFVCVDMFEEVWINQSIVKLNMMWLKL